MDTGHGAVVFNKVTGVKNHIYKEGWHLMVPWFERPIVYDLQSRPLTLKSVTGSQGKRTPKSIAYLVINLSSHLKERCV